MPVWVKASMHSRKSRRHRPGIATGLITAIGRITVITVRIIVITHTGATSRVDKVRAVCGMPCFQFPVL